jgi:hypothetical protein
MATNAAGRSTFVEEPDYALVITGRVVPSPSAPPNVRRDRADRMGATPVRPMPAAGIYGPWLPGFLSGMVVALAAVFVALALF